MLPISTIIQRNVAGKVLQYLLVFCIQWVLVRLLAAEQSGFFFNDLYRVLFICFLLSAGLDYSAIAWISSKGAGTRRIIFHLIWVGIVGSLVLWLIIWFGFPFANIQLNTSRLVLVTFGVGNLFLLLLVGVLTAHQRFQSINRVLNSTNALFLLGLLIYAHSEAIPNVGYLLTAYGGLCVLQAITLLFVSMQLPSETDEQPIDWASFYRYGVGIMAGALVFFCFIRVDHFFVERYCTPATLGNYVQGGKIGQYYLHAGSLISSSLLPILSKNKPAWTFDQWFRQVRWYMFAMAVATILLLLAGSSLYPWVFGAGFNEMHVYMNGLLPGYFCLGLVTIMNAVFLAKGKIAMLFWSDLIGLLLVIVFDWLIVPDYGAIGAAIVHATVYFLLFLFLLINIRKQF